jgi:hypothetical protein
MDLLFYSILSAGYIMIMHFAVAISKQFKLTSLFTIFIFGGIIGYFLKAYEFGFFIAVILSLVLW